jgi:hypothetical protein
MSVTLVAKALEYALKLATIGEIPCFPCRPDKKPCCEHGFKDATKDPEQLQQLWQRYPGTLVGVPTGEPSGVFVIDIDSVKHTEADEWLERHSPYLPRTRLHRTQSGGLHLLFQHQPGLKNSTSKLALGVDTRGEGGYIIWWPFHLNPETADHRLLPLAPVPQWIVEALKPPERIIPFPTPRPPSGNVHGAMARVEGIVATVALAHQGVRNSITFWGACKIRDMIADRELDITDGQHAVEALAEAASRTGLSSWEIQRTIFSAARPK